MFILQARLVTFITFFFLSPVNRYTFLKVLPGNYDITASHPSWTLEKVGSSTSPQLTVDEKKNPFKSMMSQTVTTVCDIKLEMTFK